MIPVPRGNFAATSFTISRATLLEILISSPRICPKEFLFPQSTIKFQLRPILFSAQNDALCKPYEVRYYPSKNSSNVTIHGNYKHRVDLVYGPKNRTYYEGEYDVLPVAVVEPIPFRVKLHKPATPIVRGGSLA